MSKIYLLIARCEFFTLSKKKVAKKKEKFINLSLPFVPADSHHKCILHDVTTHRFVLYLHYNEQDPNCYDQKNENQFR